MDTKEKKGKGSFCIPRAAMDLMIKHKLSVAAILAYLIIAAYSDESGTKSTAGAKAVMNRLGCRLEVADRAIEDLVSIGLLVDLRGVRGDRSEARNIVRFEVPDFGEPLESRVWFGMSLVETETVGIRVRCRQMVKLYDAKPECLHMLIWLHSLQDDHWVAARPPMPWADQRGIFFRYVFDVDQDTNDLHPSHRIQIAHLPDVDWWGCPVDRDLIRATLTFLQWEGFIYEVVMVFNRPLVPFGSDPLDTFIAEDSKPVFHLHGKLGRVGKNSEELGVSHLTQITTKYGEHKTFCKDGFIDNSYVLITPPGQTFGVAGLFRMRHRVRNAKNLGVAESWAKLMDSEDDYREWLAEILAKDYSISVDNFAQHQKFNSKRAQIAARHTP
jgi:hypothetical protein